MSKQETLWISICFVLGPDNMVPLVMDPNKGPPHYWKFPGGHEETGETETETAVREVFEETGVSVNCLEYQTTDDSGQLPVHLFCGLTDSFDNLKKRGNDGEHVKLVNVRDILQMKNFLRSHFKLLQKAGLVA